MDAEKEIHQFMRLKNAQINAHHKTISDWFPIGCSFDKKEIENK